MDNSIIFHIENGVYRRGSVSRTSSSQVEPSLRSTRARGTQGSHRLNGLALPSFLKRFRANMSKSPRKASLPRTISVRECYGKSKVPPPFNASRPDIFARSVLANRRQTLQPHHLSWRKFSHQNGTSLPCPDRKGSFREEDFEIYGKSSLSSELQGVRMLNYKSRDEIGYSHNE